MVTCSMKRRRGTLVLMLSILAALAWSTHSPSRRSRLPLEQQSVEQLINALADVSQMGPGYDLGGDPLYFFLPDCEYELALSRAYGEEAPHIAAEVRELVSRGVAALPALLNHLDDSRPTRVRFVTHSYDELGWDGSDVLPDAAGYLLESLHDGWHYGTIRGIEDSALSLRQVHRRLAGKPEPYEHRIADIYFSEVYDSRPRGEAPQPPDTYAAKDESYRNRAYQLGARTSDLTIRVGDICFAAVGQIVNRDFGVLNYESNNTLRLNSPVAKPALAAAARHDWAGLTAAAHRDHLIADARAPTWWTDYQTPVGTAVRRLCFYYPREAERVVMSLLARQIYDPSREMDVMDRFPRHQGPTEWLHWFETARMEDGLPCAAAAVLWLSEYEPDPDTAKEFAAASAFLRPRVEALLDLTEVVHPEQQAELIRQLGRLRSPPVDAAVERVFDRALEQSRAADRSDLWSLAEACTERFSGTPQADRYRPYLWKPVAFR